jgi:hypothetical protein
MKVDYVYIDNFRGFEKALVPIKNVNFLVGENSSGKSSFMAALCAIKDNRLWSEELFNNEYFSFSRFSDLVSSCGNNSDEFRIGYIRVNNEADLQFGSVVCRSSKGKTVVYSVEMGGKHGYVISKNMDGIKTFKCIKHRSYDFQKIIDDVVKRWGSHVENENEFKKINAIIKDFPDNFPAYYARALLLKGLNKSDEDEVFSYGIDFASDEIAWIAPIRTKPLRTYDGILDKYSSDGEHTPYLIKNIMSSESVSKRENFTKFINAFGISSGLFTSLGTHQYGEHPNAPFELCINLGKNDLPVNNVGYGVSQSLPIVVEIFNRRPKSILFIQQPEVHLHPRGQAALGDVISQESEKNGKRFIVETHSDYLIDRYRYNRKMGGKKSSAQILYFLHEDGINRIRPIEIMDDGKLIDEGNGYRDFFVNESMKMLDV